MDQLMVDIETIDTSVTAAVVSIGAVRFSIKDTEVDTNGFYVVLDLQEQALARRTISIDTFQWWTQQSDEARSVFAAEEKLSMKLACESFANYAQGTNTLWAKGPTFDNMILRSLFLSAEVNFPYTFWQDRDCRTLNQIAEGLGAEEPGMAPGTAHNALADAVHQANYVVEICKALKV